MLSLPISDAPALKADDAPPILRSPALMDLPYIQHGFSTRTCGNLATRYGPPAEVAAARRTFARLTGIDSNRVAHFGLTHSSRVGLVSEADAVPIDETPYRISIRGLLCDAGPHDLSFTSPQGVSNQSGVDCLITTTPGVSLFMVVGDSAPVLLIAPGGKAIALAHVGIVGTVNHVLENTIRTLCRIVPCRPSEITAVIGPTVGPCCYALAQSLTWAQVVAQVFFDEYGPKGPGIVVRNNQYFFDLPAAITDVLRRERLLPSMIHAMNICTACPHTPFFSHQAGIAGRFGTLLALRSV